LSQHSATSAFAVEVSGARLSYAGRLLFDDLSVTLEAGRLTCLLGPSGVGKTTLLRLIAGLAPEGASARIACSDGGEIEGRLAYMAQQDLLLPWLSVVGNVLLGARLRGEPPDEARARQLLAAVDLGANANDYPATLSGGMRQRAAVARTLMEDRPLVLMDEPFSALDTITRLRLQSLAAETLGGRTILLVTHDPLEALRLGHRIYLMAGSPARLGTPIEPPGLPPRAPGDPAVLAQQAELIALLSRQAQQLNGRAA
jgi:putative hydroxymethylpyrimidine transport system ATP-binding protein